MIVFIGMNIISFILLIIFNRDVLAFRICFFVMISVTNLIENLACSLVSRIIPIRFQLGCLPENTTISIVSTAGKIIASIFIYLVWQERVLVIIFSVFLGLFLILMLVLVLFGNGLKEKAISRLLKQRKELRPRK